MPDLVGKTIVAVREMTAAELDAEGWEGTRWGGGGVTAIELDDGTVLYPSRDDEGNDAGALFGVNSDGEIFCVTMVEEDPDAKS